MQLGSMIAMGRRSAGPSVVSQGLDALRKYGANAHLWLPGVGYFNGQDLGNYLDSAGMTAASVDNPIGLVLDQLYGQGALGTNLVSNPGGPFTAATGWATNNSATVAASAGQLTVTNTAASYGGGVASFATTIGASYTVKYRAWITSGTLSWLLIGTAVGGNSVATITLPASQPSVDLTYSFVATSTTTYFTFQNNNTSGFALAVGSITCQPVLGIPASQATTANKPTLRRGLVNQVLYSSDFTNAAWGKGAGVAAVTPGLTDPYGGTYATRITPLQGSGCYLSQNVSLLNGATYTRVAIVKPETDGTLAMEFVDNGAYTNTIFNVFTKAVTGTATSGASIADMGNGWFICLRTWTTGATGAQGAGAWYTNNYGAATSSNTLVVHRVALIQGAITAQQVLQCAGIPLTTTAATSSSGGNFQFGFTGGSQSLSFPQTAWTTSDDHVVVQGITAGNASTTLPSFTVGVSLSRYPVLYVGAGGYLTASWRDDTGAGVSATSPLLVATGESLVASAKKVGTTGYVRKNGAPTSAAITGLGTTTISTAFIGASPAASWVGAVYPTVMVKGTVSDTDLLAIERMVGTLTGPTGVIF